MGRHLAPGRGRVVLRADGLEEHLVGSDPELKDERAVPVVAVEPVVPGLQDHPGRRADRLVAGAVDLKVDLVLALELDLFVVETTGKIDVAVGGDQRLRIEAAVSLGSDLGRHFASGGEYTKGVRAGRVAEGTRRGARTA